jgi:uroporphyrinogen-III synthase
MARPVLQRLFVTRPADESRLWVESLREKGWPAVSLPLIEISSPANAAVLAQRECIRGQAHAYDALMFVSGAAIDHFFRDLPPLPWSRKTRFWAPGPATGRRLRSALLGAGVDPGQVDMPPQTAENFDSEALWPVVCGQVRPGARVLIVRGSSDGVAPASAGSLPGVGREWLVARCREAGALVEACVAYERRVPCWTDRELKDMHEGSSDGSVWLFSSSEALDHLAAAPVKADWSACPAIVTHPRIAEKAHAAGFSPVMTVRPTLPDLLVALESGWRRP